MKEEKEKMVVNHHFGTNNLGDMLKEERGDFHIRVLDWNSFLCNFKAKIIWVNSGNVLQLLLLIYQGVKNHLVTRHLT